PAAPAAAVIAPRGAGSPRYGRRSALSRRLGSQFAPGLPDDMPAARYAKASQDGRDKDIGPCRPRAEDAESGRNDGDIADCVVARAYPHRLAIGVAFPMPPQNQRAE